MRIQDGTERSLIVGDLKGQSAADGIRELLDHPRRRGRLTSAQLNHDYSAVLTHQLDTPSGLANGLAFPTLALRTWNGP